MKILIEKKNEKRFMSIFTCAFAFECIEAINCIHIDLFIHATINHIVCLLLESGVNAVYEHVLYGR